MAKIIAGKVVYGAICLLAAVLLVVSGYAHKTVSSIEEAGQGVAITSSPSTGAMNILVMGLESRTDFQGNTISHHMQVVLHSGSQGGQATNTLMLIHIDAGGKHAVGFSIPRDDLVTFPQKYLGFSRGKIDAAYGWAYNEYLNNHPNDADRFKGANNAGQLATIDTVESVTGVKVDHFLEVNLIGFYYLAQAFGGIGVCIMPNPGNKGANLTDKDPFTGIDHSGFDAIKDGYNLKQGGKQYLHLNAAQSLAYIRSRDTLPGTDLGRTKRQQAAIDYVIWNFKNSGLFSNLGKLNSLLGVAKKYLQFDSGFNLLEFAPSMSALNPEDLKFTTLPFTTEQGVSIAGYPTPQDVNIIDVPKIQQIVKSAFYPSSSGSSPGVSAAPTGNVTVDVYNGNPGAIGLAGSVSTALTKLGYKAGKAANASEQQETVREGTQIFFGAGAQENAQQIALQFGTTATELDSLPASHVEVLLGSTATVVPDGLAPTATATGGTASTQVIGASVVGGAEQPTTSPTPAATPTATEDPADSTAGTAITVPKNAKWGVPCVY